MTRPLGCLAALGVVAVLAGCYGSTESATGVGEDTATLRGQGTTNDGPATSWFEYWTDGDPLPGQPRPRTPSRSWPGGISEPDRGEGEPDLLVASAYSFRLCGNDTGEQPVCAQTRTFSTPALAGDYVKGAFSGSEPQTGAPYTIRFNARSGPNGENPRGTVKLTFAGRTTTDTVVCLRVGSGFANVGATREAGGSILYGVRNAPEEPPGWGTAALSSPADCDNAGAFTQVPHTQRSFVLHDEP